MQKIFYVYSRLRACVVVLVVLTTTRTIWGCACGCDIFDVGTSSMLPTEPGWMLYVGYDFLDQNQNWSGTSTAPASHNDDKELKTSFTDVGLQYLINSSWGFQVQVPYNFRSFTTETDAGKIVTRDWSQFGDVRLEGLYTGFSPDLSAGVNLGVQLPTGNYKFDPNIVDRDSQLGTGSTNLLIGGFYRHHISLPAKLFWFAQTELDLPVLTQESYRPGLELDSAVGMYYTGWNVGGGVKVVPVGQVLIGERTTDSGAQSAHPAASGYQRILLSPGIEVDVHKLKFYADAEVPVYQNFVGNQIAGAVLIKATIGYAF